MRASLPVALLVTLSLSPCMNAYSKSKVLITDIAPGYVTAGKQNVVILSGKKLSDVKGCQLDPMTAALQPSVSTPIHCSEVASIEGSGQLRLTFSLTDTADMYYALTLTDAPPGSTTAGNSLAIVTIHATGASGVNPAPGPAASPSGQSPTSPYANCLNGNAAPGSQLSPPSGSVALAVNCASSLLTEGEVSDNFGQHVGHTYYAIQVRISNGNSNYDFLLRDILLTLPDGRVVSGRIRRFAQGVAVKGKSLDRRAAFYNSLQAGSGLFGGLAVFASAGFKTAGNVLQGSFLSGFAQIFPDYTADNVNRFNTAVFDDQNPAIVPKDSIGQPPLYVVALVPKTPDIVDSRQHYAQSIAVSIEGTFIKQVSLVSLSQTSLDFGLEYISPDSIAGLIGLPNTTDNLNALRAVGTTQKVTISNNNSSPMNISKVAIVSSTKSSNISTGDDFSFDPKQTDCGRTSTSGDFSPSNAFAIAPQSFCTLVVHFHPGGLSNAAANIVLQGSSLDGPTSIALTGKSVGLVVDSQAISVSGSPTVAKPMGFPCSYQSCTLDLGSVSLNGTSTTVTVPILLVNTGNTFTLTAHQDTNATALDTSSTSCKPHLESDLTGPPAPCNLVLPLDPTKSSTTLKLTNSSPSWSSSITITYQSKPTAVVLDSATLSGTEAVAIPITGKVNDVTSSPVVITTGSVAVFDATTSAQLGVATIDAATGKFSVSPGLLAAGTYSYKVAYIGKDIYETSPSQPVGVKITGPAVITPPATTITVKSGSVTPAFTVKTAKGTACSGTLTFTPSAGGTTITSPVSASGSATLLIPAGGAIGATVSGGLTLPDASGSCTVPAAPVPFSYTLTP